MNKILLKTKTSFGETGLHLSEDVQFLVFLVRDYRGISVVGELCLPLNEGGLAAGHGSHGDAALDASGHVRRFGRDHFVTE